MATDFPNSIDNLTNPISSDKMNVVLHADQHANANDAIEAIETYIGVEGETDTNTLTGKIDALETASSTYLTENQEITLTPTGDVTGTASGTTSLTPNLVIGVNKVTNSQLAQVDPNIFKGRATAGIGNVEDLTGTQATALLNTFTSSLKGLVPPPGAVDGYLNSDGTWSVPTSNPGTVTSFSFSNANGFVGNVTNSTSTPQLTLSTNLTGIIKGNGTAFSAATAGTDYENPLTFSTGLTRSTNTITVNTSQNIAKLSNLTTNGFVKTTGSDGTLSVDTSTYLTANQTITLSGDVSGSGTTGITTTIGANKVTNAMLSTIATARIRGRVTAGTGNVEDLTGTQATTLLDTFTTSLKGLAPSSGGGTTNYLRADGTWAAPPGATSGTVTTVSVVSANGFAGTVANPTTTPAITLTTSVTGLLKGNGTAISAAASGTDYEVPLTFSTGLTRSTNTVTVNTSQNIATLSNLTTNGFVRTGGGVGTLSSSALLLSDITTGTDKQIVYGSGGTGVTQSSNFLFDSSINKLTIGSAATSNTRNGLLINDGGLSILGRIDESTTDIRFVMGLGPSGDSARCMFGHPTRNWEIDNVSGVFRWFTPGVVQMYLYSADGGNMLDLLTNKHIVNAGNFQYTGGITQSGSNANTFTATTTFSACNIATDTTTGMKIGTSTSQKIGFFNATPIVQVGATIDLGTVLSNLGLRASGTAYPITTSGAVTFTGLVSINANNIATDTTTGMKIGTGTTQKIAFYNSTPIVQPGATTDLGTVLSNLGLRAAGTAYPITTSGAVALTGNGVTSDNLIFNNNAITASSNAATVPVTFRLSTVTNNSAATLTITITTTAAVDGQLLMVRVKDFSAAAQTITWVNTENSTVSVPTTSNGSTTLPLTVGFMYNSATTKWRCVGVV